MNISLNHLIYDVLELYRANLKDTSSIDSRQVAHWINSARAFLIKQRLDKNIFDIYQEEIQKMSNLSLVETTGNTGTVETSTTIPSTINRKGYPGTLTRVGYPYTSTDLAFNASPVQIVTPRRFQRVGNRKFNSGFYYSTIGTGRKLYFKTYTLVGSDKITLEGVFQNPIEVMVLNGVSDPNDADYPINSSLIKDLTSIASSDKFQMILQQKEDKIEDGRDSTTT